MLNAQDIAAIYPLAPQQRGMLLESLRAPGSGIFIEQAVLTLRGELDRAALRRAWQHLFTRHPILRTAFVWEKRLEPLQVVLHQVESDVAEIPAEGDPWAALAAYLVADAARGFALQQAPLMRLAVLSQDVLSQDVLSQDGLSQNPDAPLGEHLLVWTVHHLLLDGWCRARVLSELMTLYGQARAGQSPALPPARPYQDYITWLGQRDLAQAERFWRARLRGIRAPTALPQASTPALSDRARYGSAKSGLSAATTAQLRARARARRVTLNTVVQGAVAVLLSRYSDQSEVVLGTTVAGRPADLPGVETIVGPFVNTLPLRLDLPARGTFWEFLTTVQRHHLELREFEYCSEGQVHQWSEVPGALPLYHCVLVFENYPLVAADADAAAAPAAGSTGLGIELTHREQHGARTKYLLTLLAFAHACLEFELIHDARQLVPADAERLLVHLTTLLARVATADPDLASLRQAITDPEVPRVWPLPTLPAADRPLSQTLVAGSREARLVELWQEVLGVPPHDLFSSFFAAGGHSLLATELLAKIRREFASQLSLQTLFQTPTVAGLALALTQEQAAVAPAAPSSAAAASPTLVARPAERYQPFPLTGIQSLYWQARCGTSAVDLPGVNLYFQLQLARTPDQVARLNAALNALIARHDPLRTVFLPSGEQQVLAAVPQFQLPEVDLSRLRPPDRERAVAALGDALRYCRAPLDRFPLFAFVVQRWDRQTLRFHGRVEALLLDGESRDLLFHELRELLAEPQTRAPRPSWTFRDYAVAHREWQPHPLYCAARSFWQKRAPALKDLARLPPAALGRAAPRYLRVTQELLGPWRWQRLQARATARGLTPSSVVISVFARHFATLSGQRAFTLPLVSNFRPDFAPELASMVGNFDTFYLISVADAGAAISALAAQLQQEIAAALEHRHLTGVEVLSELLALSTLPPVRFNSLIELSRPHPRTAPTLPRNAAFASVDLSLTLPQTQLTCIVALTHRGALVALWQALDGILSAAAWARLQVSYRATLRELAAKSSAWERRSEPEMESP